MAEYERTTANVGLTLSEYGLVIEALRHSLARYEHKVTIAREMTKKKTEPGDAEFIHALETREQAIRVLLAFFQTNHDDHIDAVKANYLAGIGGY